MINLNRLQVNLSFAFEEWANSQNKAFFKVEQILLNYDMFFKTGISFSYLCRIFSVSYNLKLKPN